VNAGGHERNQRQRKGENLLSRRPARTAYPPPKAPERVQAGAKSSKNDNKRGQAGSESNVTDNITKIIYWVFPVRGGREYSARNSMGQRSKDLGK